MFGITADAGPSFKRVVTRRGRMEKKRLSMMIERGKSSKLGNTTVDTSAL